MIRQLFAIVVVILLATSVQAREYVAGQLWFYKAPSGDDKSLLLINLVETAPDKSDIFHVSVLNVHMPNLKGGPRQLTDLPHFPVSRETLDKSLLKVVGTQKPHADYRAGYDLWRSAFDKGKAGVFTISIAEIIEVIVKTIPQGST